MKRVKKQRVDKEVSDFLIELKHKTGVDDVFISNMRPQVQRVFASTPNSRLSKEKSVFVKKAQIRVRTQIDLKNTLEHLNILSERKIATKVVSKAEAQRLSFTTALVVNTLLKTYGGFGPVDKIYS